MSSTPSIARTVGSPRRMSPPRFRRERPASGVSSCARPSNISAVCCSSCSSSARCRPSRCWRAWSSKGRSASASPTPRGRACCSSPGTSASGNCRRWCTRSSCSRWRCWLVRSTTSCSTRCSSGFAPRTGNSVIYRKGTIRRVMRMLQAGQGVGVLIDQHIMSRDAIYVDFFDRPAATTSAVAALALRTGAPVVPLFALPLGGGRYRMIYEHPVEPPPAGRRERRSRVHAALHRRARDVRPAPSRAVALDAPPLARRSVGAARDVPVGDGVIDEVQPRSHGAYGGHGFFWNALRVLVSPW